MLLCLPTLSLSAANAIRPINPNLMETYGWPQFVNQVLQAEAQQPARTPIFTSNYGEAGESETVLREYPVPATAWHLGTIVARAAGHRLMRARQILIAGRLCKDAG